MENNDWNEMMNQTAEQIWGEQQEEVKRNILFETGLSSTLVNTKWTELSPEQQKNIEKFLCS